MGAVSHNYANFQTCFETNCLACCYTSEIPLDYPSHIGGEVSITTSPSAPNNGRASLVTLRNCATISGDLDGVNNIKEICDSPALPSTPKTEIISCLDSGNWDLFPGCFRELNHSLFQVHIQTKYNFFQRRQAMVSVLLKFEVLENYKKLKPIIICTVISTSEVFCSRTYNTPSCIQWCDGIDQCSPAGNMNDELGCPCEALVTTSNLSKLNFVC